MFGNTGYERHEHQRFDGAPCGRDQWVLVGAVDSCTQGRQGKRITVSSIQIHTGREADINMHRYRRRRRGFEQKCAWCKHPREMNPSLESDASVPTVFPQLVYAREECISPHPCSICRLKSHLHPGALCAVLPFRRLPNCLICQPCSSLPPAAARGATDTFIVLLFPALTRPHPARSHLPPAQDAGPQ